MALSVLVNNAAPSSDELFQPRSTSAVSYSRNGEFLGVSTGGMAQAELLSGSTGKLLRNFTVAPRHFVAGAPPFAAADPQDSPEALSAPIPGVAVSPLDGRCIATVGYDPVARVLDCRTGAQVLKCEHNDWLRACCFAQEGRALVTAADDGCGRLWDLDTGVRLSVLNAHVAGSHLMAVACSDDSKLLLTGSSDMQAILWDGATGAKLRALQGHSMSLIAVALGGGTEPLAATGSVDGTAQVWSLRTGTRLAVLPLPESPWVAGLAFTPDGSHLATASHDGVLRVFGGLGGPGGATEVASWRQPQGRSLVALAAAPAAKPGEAVFAAGDLGGGLAILGFAPGAQPM